MVGLVDKYGSAFLPISSNAEIEREYQTRLQLLPS